MTMDLDANQLSFEVDSYALFVCKELVQILSSNYQVGPADAVRMMNLYWGTADLREDPYFGNRTAEYWAQIVHQNYLRSFPPSGVLLTQCGRLTLPETIRIVRRVLSEDLTQSKTLLSGRTVEEVVELRSSHPFDHRWNASLNSLRGGDKFIEGEFWESERLVFEIVGRELGSSDLAAHVSDDASLILHAAKQGKHEPWISALFGAYIDGHVPFGALAESESVSLVSQICQARHEQR